MDIKRIFDRLLVMSGQFLLKTNNVELDVDKFRELVALSLATYSKHCPHDQHFFVNFSGARGMNLTPELILNVTGCDYLGTPDWISDVLPYRLLNINPFYLFKNLDPSYNKDLNPKTFLPWEYRKPILYVSVATEADVHGVWKHKIRERELAGEGLVFDIPTITDEDVLFFELLQSRFLKAIGKSRRAFTLNDLPLIMDASDIASEGEALEEKALEDIQNHQKFYLAYGG